MAKHFALVVVLVSISMALSADPEQGDDRVFLVLASYTRMQSAIALERRLEKVFSGVHSDTKLVAGTLYNRVLLGPVARGDVERMRLLLEAQGVTGTWAIPAAGFGPVATREARFIEPPQAPGPVPDEKQEQHKKRYKHYNPATLVLPERVLPESVSPRQDSNRRQE